MRKLRITIGIVACAAAVLVPTAGSVVTGTRAETKPGLGILCASVLAESRPVELRAGELTVAFPPGSEFLRRKADTETYRACVLEALKAVTGQAPTLAYELRELEVGMAAAGGTDGPGNPPPLTEEEWVARFVTEFDAEEIIPEAPPEETA